MANEHGKKPFVEHPVVQQGFETDEQLIAQLRAGDEAAASELFEKHHHATFVHALQIVNNEVTADDIASEAFLRVFEALRRGKGPTVSMRLYLKTVVRSIVADQGRVRESASSDEVMATIVNGNSETVFTSYAEGTARAANVFAQNAVASTQSDVLGGAESPDADDVVAAFNQLSEPHQNVLWLRHVQGLSLSETAKTMRRAAPVTSALYTRARTSLRDGYLVEMARHSASASCQRVVADLGRYVMGSAGARRAKRVDDHLLHCSSCQANVSRLRNVAERFQLAIPFGVAGLVGGAALHPPSEVEVSGVVHSFLQPHAQSWSDARRAAPVVGPRALAACGVVTLAVVGAAFVTQTAVPAPPAPQPKLSKAAAPPEETVSSRGAPSLATALPECEVSASSAREGEGLRLLVRGADAGAETDAASEAVACLVTLSRNDEVLHQSAIANASQSLAAQMPGLYTLKLEAKSGVQTLHYKVS